MKAERCTDQYSHEMHMFKLALYCLSVTVEDLNLWQIYKYEDINFLGTHYFIPLNSTLGAR